MTSKSYLLALCLGLSCTCAVSASFDCAKASSRIEVAICSDSALDALDVELASAYAKAIVVDPNLKKPQRDWLKQRNTCADNDCIRKAYADRIRELQALTTPEPSKALATAAASAETASPATAPAQAVPVPETAPQQSPVLSSQPAPGPAVKAEPPRARSAGEHETGLLDSLDQWFRSNFLVIAGVVVLALVYVIYGYARGCPSCRKWYAAKEVNRELLGRSVENRTVTRKDEHKDREGRLIKTVERQEQIQVTVSRHRHYYKCKYCGHEWTSVTTSESS